MNSNKNYARQASRKLSAFILLCVLAVQPALAQSFSGAQAISDNGIIVGGSTGTGIIFDAFLIDGGVFRGLTSVRSAVGKHWRGPSTTSDRSWVGQQPRQGRRTLSCTRTAQ